MGWIRSSNEHEAPPIRIKQTKWQTSWVLHSFSSTWMYVLGPTVGTNTAGPDCLASYPLCISNTNTIRLGNQWLPCQRISAHESSKWPCFVFCVLCDLASRAWARPLCATYLLLWKVVSKETAFGGGEHHTNGTRVDEEDRVPANALAKGLRRTEQGRWVSHGGNRWR
jgi:hypothetical protein